VENINERQNHLEDPKTLSATRQPESALLEPRHHTSSSRSASEETVNELWE